MPDVKQRMLQLGFIQQLHTWHWKVLYWWDIFFRNSEENFIMWGTEHKTTAGVKHLRISAPVWGICVCEKSTNCSVTAPKVSSVSLTTNIDGECHLVCCCLLNYLSLVAPWSSSQRQTVSESRVHLNTDGTLSIQLTFIVGNYASYYDWQSLTTDLELWNGTQFSITTTWFMLTTFAGWLCLYRHTYRHTYTIQLALIDWSLPWPCLPSI